MTLRSPYWLENGSYTGDDDRLALQTLLGGSPNLPLVSGVIAPGDYKVAQTGTASMNLTVKGGGAWIAGAQSATEGAQAVVNDDDSQTVTISTANGSNPRIDSVVLQVRNSVYSGTHDDAILTVVKGTAAASPTPPALAADELLLAQVLVGTAVTSITNANITDGRVLFAAANRQASGHLASTFAVTGSAATFLTTASLSVGTWLVTLTALCNNLAASSSLETQVVAGTATASFEGATSSEVGTAAGVQVGITVSYTFLATVTAAGTLTFQAKGAASGHTILATTGSNAFAKATGYTAIRQF